MNLYIFAIGGTGCRVVKALTMLLASGVKMNKSVEKVIPIILDLDVRNGDRVRTIKMLKQYQKIKKEGLNDDGFFAQDITTINEVMTDMEGAQDYAFEFNENSNFKEYLNYNQMDPDTKGVIDLLFEQEILDTDLTVGFKGYPNVGTVVLNKFTHSEFMKQFVNQLNPNDRIMIVSSIFGGTGASGFPLLLNTLRDNSENGLFEGMEKLNQVKIGAISVMPYFKLVADDNSAIDSNAFITKTITALDFYKDNLTNLNAMYYLGAENGEGDAYKNAEGEAAQKNNAHFIELAAALAIQNFSMKTNEELSGTCRYHEFGLDTVLNGREFNFTDLKSEDRALIEHDMNRFTLFGHVLTKYIAHKEVIGSNWYKILFKDNENVREFLNKVQEFYEDKEDGYFSFLTEMKENDKSFAPYNLSAEKCGELLAYNPIGSKGFFGGWSAREINDFNGFMNEEANAAQGTNQQTRFDLESVLTVVEKACDKFLASNKN